MLGSRPQEAVRMPRRKVRDICSNPVRKRLDCAFFPQPRTGRALGPRAALAVPAPARETLERGRKGAAVCADGEAEPPRRHFLLWRGVKAGELDHSAQSLVARAGEES